jgi:hypothetical protein
MSHATKISRVTVMMLAFAFILVPLWSRASSPAGEITAKFEAANRLYEEGKFVEAAAAYSKLVDAGAVSAAVYFNRGNTYFRLGKTGWAIVDYLLASRLAPRDRELRSNLNIARTKARGGAVYSEPKAQKILGVLTVNEWALLTAAGVWGLFIFLAMTQWRVDLKPILQKYAMASAAVAVIAGACLAVKLNADYFTDRAVVVTGEAEVRNGPLDEAIELFRVRDGAEVEVLDRKEGWLQITDVAQRVGWVKSTQVVEVTAK